MKKLIYLAAPYSHPDYSVMERRFDIVNQVAFNLIKKKGYFLFSPISHNHPITDIGFIPLEWERWEEWCLSFLNICEKLIVLQLDEWEISVGVAAEIKFAKKLGIDVEYMSLEEINGLIEN